MKKILIASAVVMMGIISCKEEKKVVDVAYFKDMQILPPDIACSDTLIVVDADGLNKAFAPVEQGLAGHDWGDEQYDSLFHIYCLTFDQYVQELEGIGWRLDIAQHIANVDFGRIPKDELYDAMMED